VVVLDGSWKSGTSFRVAFRGHGSARLWVQSEGDLANSVGAVLPRATKEGTIGIPASSPELIAVGATINRLLWKDRDGDSIAVGSFGSLDNPAADSTAYFSGAGPTSDGRMKPDIVAPGVFVVGAMSKLADPKTAGEEGIFGGSRVCADSPGCLVVDDYHAISSGTSMAAPIVAGAIALLLERDPTLDQPELRTLLQAGSRRPSGVVLVEQQVGPGSLDLIGSLQVLEQRGVRARRAGCCPELDRAGRFLRPSRSTMAAFRSDPAPERERRDRRRGPGAARARRRAGQPIQPT
jgi:subtilisin family serine protease